MVEIPLWRGGRPATSLDREPLLGYRGEPVAQVNRAPALLVHRVAAELRKAAPGPAEDPQARWDAIARAGALLTGEPGELGGLTTADHARLVTLATGAPYSDTLRALEELAAGLQNVEAALRRQAPGGDLAAFRTHRISPGADQTDAWVPNGRVLGFVAPSNHPAVHLAWVLALAMGWTVLLRPGADDPLTPWRLTLALAAAGFPAERLAILPGGHDLVPALIEACDRTVAYGGAALAGLVGRDSRVLFNGPGHSKVFVDAGVAAQDRLSEFLVECVAHDGGRKCTCASAIVVRGEAPALLHDVAERLRALPLLDPLDPAARVPAWKDAAAAGQTGAKTVVCDGLTFVAPDLFLCAAPTTQPFGREIPAPWATAVQLPADGDPLPVLTGSLAVTLLSPDDGLKAACLFAPTIRKLFAGRVPPWYSEPGAPHQGRLSEFLFTSKLCREG